MFLRRCFSCGNPGRDWVDGRTVCSDCRDALVGVGAEGKIHTWQPYDIVTGRYNESLDEDLEAWQENAVRAMEDVSCECA